MKRAAFALLLLSGCIGVDDLRADAERCEAARDSAGRRYDCSAFWRAVANEQADDRRRHEAAQAFARRTSLDCTSRRAGDTVETHCE